MKRTRSTYLKICLAASVALAGFGAFASSHREAPFITRNPKVDATDFYMFQSYESGRDDGGFTTIIANYQPMQNKYGGPNFFQMDPNALYEIHIDNGDGGAGATADGIEDLTFQFRFQNSTPSVALTIAAPDGGASATVPIPLRAAGQVSGTGGSLAALNGDETFTLSLVRGPRRGSAALPITASDGGTVFAKPVDNFGTKTFGGASGYDTYSRNYIQDITIPGCATPGRVFVGQRAESFAVNLGPVFDLINAPASVLTGGSTEAGRGQGGVNPIGDTNITSLALELPTSCIIHDAANPIIGGWTTASMRQARVLNPTATYTDPAREGGAWVQVSRLSNPLVNEAVIGLPDKDKFNGSEPKDDLQFAAYVTNPTLPALIELLFGTANAPAPRVIPRVDLVAVFLQGVPGVNVNGSLAEMIRLNTAAQYGLPAVTVQADLGLATCLDPATATSPANPDPALPGCDLAGFPNGRRPGDDVTDLALRVMEGVILPTSAAGAGQAAWTDGVWQNYTQFDSTFPYLKSPNSPD